MKYNILGKTDLRVSRLCLGCMTFGEPNRGNHAWTLPEESSRPIIKHALEGGINFSIPPTATPLAVAKRLSVARCVISPAAKMSWSLPRFFTRLMI
jgi:predicted aldo/keto reductase-like oxidoreductase